MTSTFRALPRTAVAALAALAIVCPLTSTIGSAVAGADVTSTIGLEPTPGKEQSYPDDHLALAWGIRSSFMNYVDGHKPQHVLDGARFLNGSVQWPYISTSTLADGRIQVQYGGTVNFMQYCPQDGTGYVRGQCDLDLTFADPRIVFDPATGEGELFINRHTKQYNGGWFGPEEVLLGDLNVDAGRFNSADGVVTWDHVTATLTEEGNAAFSNFYTAGGNLAPLNFSYPGDFTGAVEGPAYRATSDVITDIPWDNAVSVFEHSSGAVIVVANYDGKGYVQGYSADLKTRLFSQEIDSRASSDAAWDKRTDTLYYSGSDELSVHKVTVTESGLSGDTVAVTVPGTSTITVQGQTQEATNKVTGVAFGEETGTLGVLYKTGRQHGGFISVDRAGTVKNWALPRASDVLGKELNDDYSVYIYGDTYNAGYRTGLRALPDGTFLNVRDGNHLYEDGTVSGGVPVHINPTAETVTPIMNMVDLQDEIHGVRLGSNGTRGVAVRGDLVAIWNNFSWTESPEPQKDQTRPLIAFFRYNEADHTFARVGAGVVGDKFDEYAGVGFLTDGKAAVASGRSGEIAVVDPASAGLDGISDQIGYSQHVKDTRLPYNEGITEFSDGSLYIIDRPQDSSGKKFFVGVVRLSPTSGTSQQDSGINQVHMDYVAPVQDDTTETSAPTEPTETTAPSETSAPTEPTEPTETSAPSTSTTPDPAGNSGSASALPLLGIGALLALFAAIIHFLTHPMQIPGLPR
ncbi:HtaA domain-containing protein [Corynebacterium pygosceleis]|uniref:HtaA domain-containing protein n=1 Tax=Corynebacterium pygosceleis TaxID=2800406 RepID=UPI001902C898|nr:HtaA domain-containing protein [Corynebacterium pygosceleis]MCL0120940.1 HtaA domain-containing protein [Corynebacterium pygosceleis]